MSPKPGANQELTLKNFAGLNVQDAADKVADNEFTLLQNVFQPQKGVFSGRFGSVESLSALDVPLCSRISGIWRHYSSNQERFTIHHCEPDDTLLPDNTLDLTLQDIASSDGNIFAGGAVVQLQVTYSWIGRGMEQTYYKRYKGSNQTITLAVNTNILRVTCPAFPSGITGCNIFVQRTGQTELVYMGTITTSAGSLDVSTRIGPIAARTDALTLGDITITDAGDGTLKTGTYWVAAAWVINSDTFFPTLFSELQDIQQVVLTGKQNAIVVNAPVAASTNAAQSVYIFLGTQDPRLHPATCVGIINFGDGLDAGTYLDILTAIPSHNAQSCPDMIASDTGTPIFWNGPVVDFVGGINIANTPVKSRFGFLIAQDSDGNVKEIFPSRTMAQIVFYCMSLEVYAGDSPPAFITGVGDLHNYAAQIRTANDLYKSKNEISYSQPYDWGDVPNEPQFCFHLGITFFANGLDIPWQTDGFTLGQLSHTSGTLLPPIPRYIFEFKQQLVIAGARAGNLLYASNANAPQNWATGGSGTLLRFVTIGDAVGSGITAEGIYTPQTEATNSPNSFITAFKKNGIWMTDNIADPTSSSVPGNVGGQVSANMIQISGRVGCTAYRTVTQTPLGLVFLAADCNIYLISAVAAPRKIGTKVQNFLAHLFDRDELMRKCTAVFHDNHFKLSYPSVDAAAEDVVVNDSELWADLRTEEDNIKWFGPHLGRNIGAQVVFVGDDDDLSRHCADDAEVRTLILDGTDSIDDLGSAIVHKIKSKQYRFGSGSHYKRFFGAQLDMSLDLSYTNNVLFEGQADEYYQSVPKNISNGGAVWDTSQWDLSTFGDALYLPYAFLFGQMNLVGSKGQFTITHSDIAPFHLAEVTLFLKPESRRVVL